MEQKTTLYRFTQDWNEYKAGETFSFDLLVDLLFTGKSTGEAYQALGEMIEDRILVKTYYDPIPIDELTQQWIKDNCIPQEGSRIVRTTRTNTSGNS